MAEQLAEWTYYDDEKASLKWTKDGSTVTVTDGGDNSYTYTIPDDKVFAGMTLTVNGTAIEWPENTAYEIMGSEKITLNGDIVTADMWQYAVIVGTGHDSAWADMVQLMIDMTSVTDIYYEIDDRTITVYVTIDGVMQSSSFSYDKTKMCTYAETGYFYNNERMAGPDLKPGDHVTLPDDVIRDCGDGVGYIIEFVIESNTEKSTFTLNLDQQ